MRWGWDRYSEGVQFNAGYDTSRVYVSSHQNYAPQDVPELGNLYLNGRDSNSGPYWGSRYAVDSNDTEIWTAGVATIATSFMYGGLASALLGGGAITSDFALKKADTLFVKYGIIALFLIVTWLVLTYTPFGKHCKAIGAKQEVAHQSGVKVWMEKLAAFLICGFSCGVMASFVLFRTCSASTTSGGTTQLNTILALLLGGVPFSGGWSAKFRCVLIGSMLMAVVTSGLTIMKVSPNTQQIVKGILFVVAVAISFDRKNTAVIK